MKNLIILIALLFSYNLNAQSTTSLYEGTWVGMGYQLNNGESWSIQLNIEGDNYTVMYPSIECSSKLTVVKREGNKITLKEKTSSGQCIDGGNVELEILNSNTLRYKWSFSNGKPGSFSELIKFN